MSDLKDTLVVEAYRSRVQLYITQCDRLWTRFRYFLTIELAVAGLHFLKQSAVNSEILAPVIGIVVSTLWYVAGAQDFHFYKEHRRRIGPISAATPP